MLSEWFANHFTHWRRTNNKFIEYILKTYITTDASFPLNLWAEFATTTNRTTNSYETFHSKLNNLFIASHPNIYNFIDVLKNIQSETYIKIQNNRQRKSRQIIEKENYIRKKIIKCNHWPDTNTSKPFN